MLIAFIRVIRYRSALVEMLEVVLLALIVSYVVGGP